MTDAVTGAVDEVERSVLEVVEGGKLADLEDAWRAFFEGDLAYVSASAEPLISMGHRNMGQDFGLKDQRTYSTSLGSTPPRAELPPLPLR